MTPRTRVALAALAGALLCAEAMARLVEGDAEPSARALLGATLAAQAGLGLLGLFAAAIVPGGDPVRRLGLRPGRLGLRGTLLAALGVVALSLALHLLLQALALRDRGTLGQLDQTVRAATQGLGGTLLTLGTLALVAPVVEEVLFRGLLLGALRRLGAAAAIGLSAAAFGAFHMDAVQGAAAALLGLALGAVAWRAGSARPAIACHLVNNAVGVTTAATGLGASRLAGPWLALPLLAVATLALRAAWRRAEAPVAPDPDPQPGPAEQAAEASGPAGPGSPEG